MYTTIKQRETKKNIGVIHIEKFWQHIGIVWPTQHISSQKLITMKTLLSTAFLSIVLLTFASTESRATKETVNGKSFSTPVQDTIPKKDTLRKDTLRRDTLRLF